MITSKTGLTFVFSFLNQKKNYLWFLVVDIFKGSKAELEEVWKEEDGLDPESFDPKTFFKLHGK